MHASAVQPFSRSALSNDAHSERFSGPGAQFRIWPIAIVPPPATDSVYSVRPLMKCPREDEGKPPLYRFDSQQDMPVLTKFLPIAIRAIQKLSRINPISIQGREASVLLPRIDEIGMCFRDEAAPHAMI